MLQRVTSPWSLSAVLPTRKLCKAMKAASDDDTCELLISYRHADPSATTSSLIVRLSLATLLHLYRPP